ncbi:MAG: class I SAM-dependent methyltransferase [Thermoplasmata archaeon]|nr:class I SAM-dependent methyltransferase [Thermoplasmata archaeon]
MREEAAPDPRWVSALTGRPLAVCREAIEEARDQRRLFSHLAREHDREGRDSYVEIDAPLELHALVRLLHPEHVVEVGVSSGVSSAYLLNALEKNRSGTLHSIDRPSTPRRRSNVRAAPRISWSLPEGRSSGWAVPAPLRRRWDLRIGDKAEVLPLLARQLPRFDLVLYDVPHDESAVRGELEALDPRIPPGGVVIVDHGPGGGPCAALRRWARAHGTLPVRRQPLGLYAARRPAAIRPEHRRTRGSGTR